MEKFIVKTYYKIELARLYGVSLETLKAWVLRCQAVPAEDYKNSHILTPQQVQKIVDKLGPP